MLETLTKNFSQIAKHLRGQARLTEENIQQSLAEIRTALLDADVATAVTDEFLTQVKNEALGHKVAESLNPGKAFLGIVHRQLTVLMGDANAPLNLKKAPSVVFACGLQGVGKTTNLAKIAGHLKTRLKKRVLLAGVDIRRPAAIEQLQILAESVQVPCFQSDEMTDAVKRVKQAMVQAQQELADVLLVDTAGRTTLDDDMMDEIRRLHATCKPAETLFFIDAMQGQDAVNTAHAFNDSVPISGLVVTKFDGDSRGGAALSAKSVTGKPIKFVGVGEKLDDLELFHPDRYASRILGMGDIASLAEQVQAKTDATALHRFDKKIRKKPGSFDLNDQLAQVRQMKKIGGISNVLDKLPGNLTEKMAGMNNDKEIARMEAIICSMTPHERRQPDIIKASRKRRIANGAAVTLADVNQVLQHHNMTQKIMKRHAKNPAAMIRMMRQMLN